MTRVRTLMRSAAWRRTASRRVGRLGAVATCLSVFLAGSVRAQADLRPIETLIEQGRYSQAEQALRSLSVSNGEIDYLLGFALIPLYRFDEAEEALRRSVDAQPANIDRLHALAKSLLEQGKNLAAIEILDRALAVESRPDLHFARAMCALNAGRSRQAEENLEASLAGEPRNPEALYKLGQIALERGGYAAAREQFAASLDLDPEHLEARFSLGLAELRTGEPARAIQAFEQVLTAVPGHVGGLYNLARALQAVGRGDEARATLERFERMSATQDEADFLKQAVKKNPNNVEGRIALVGKLLELGKSDDALQETLIARGQAPRRAEIYRLLAEALKRLGRADDARQANEFALRLEAGP